MRFAGLGILVIRCELPKAKAKAKEKAKAQRIRTTDQTERQRREPVDTLLKEDELQYPLLSPRLVTA